MEKSRSKKIVTNEEWHFDARDVEDAIRAHFDVPNLAKITFNVHHDQYNDITEFTGADAEYENMENID